jgi:hypothetical protein
MGGVTVLSIDVALRTLAYAIVTFEEGALPKLRAHACADLLALAGWPPRVPSGEGCVLVVEAALPALMAAWAPFRLHAIVIERQPATNTKMRLVANALGTALRTCYSTAHLLLPGSLGPASAPPEVSFQSAALQWRAYGYREGALRGGYKAKKAAGVAAAFAAFKAHPDWAPFRLAFEAAPKRDDLADALMQALAWFLLQAPGSVPSLGGSIPGSLIGGGGAPGATGPPSRASSASS